MNDLKETRGHKPDEEPQRGPNLVLMYSLILLAMVVATAIAALIILPFYRRT
jgi:hypothetical protein